MQQKIDAQAEQIKQLLASKAELIKIANQRAATTTNIDRYADQGDSVPRGATAAAAVIATSRSQRTTASHTANNINSNDHTASMPRSRSARKIRPSSSPQNYTRPTIASAVRASGRVDSVDAGDTGGRGPSGSVLRGTGSIVPQSEHQKVLAQLAKANEHCESLARSQASLQKTLIEQGASDISGEWQKLANVFTATRTSSSSFMNGSTKHDRIVGFS